MNGLGQAHGGSFHSAPYFELAMGAGPGKGSLAGVPHFADTPCGIVPSNHGQHQTKQLGDGLCARPLFTLKSVEIVLLSARLKRIPWDSFQRSAAARRSACTKTIKQKETALQAMRGSTRGRRPSRVGSNACRAGVCAAERQIIKELRSLEIETWEGSRQNYGAVEEASRPGRFPSAILRTYASTSSRVSAPAISS